LITHQTGAPAVQLRSKFINLNSVYPVFSVVIPPGYSSQGRPRNCL